MSKLAFIRAADPKRDAGVYGVVNATQRLYVHHWVTGHQILVFSDDDAARQWAIAEGAEYHGPEQNNRRKGDR